MVVLFRLKCCCCCMKNNIFNNLVCAALIFCSFNAGSAQKKEPDPDTFLLYDQLVSLENTDLFNGREYIEKHRTINEKHKFFDSFNYLPGAVVYDGQRFYKVDLKYNIFEDLLLVQLDGSRGKTRFSLYKEDLDGFSINGHDFINVKNPEVPPAQRGIYEVLSPEGDLKLLKKHRLVMKKILEGQLLRHEFEKDKPEYFYFLNGRLIEADAGDLTDSFPKLKLQIKEFYRENRRLRRNEPEQFHKRLFNKISAIR